MSNTLIDLTGQTFGRLTVTGRAGSQGGKTTWECRCECGSTKTVRGTHLRAGAVLSCGCLNRGLSSERAKRGIRRGVLMEHVTYGGAHLRVRTVRGPASEYDCECGQAAEHWAYDHQDEGALIESRPFPRGRVRQVPYSLDPSHYQPMCRPCHREFDNNQ